MITENLIKTLAGQFLDGSEHFLVEVAIKSGNRISVLIDGDHRVNIETCIQLSRFIEHQLDRDQEDFDLTVSSAGVDRPLKLPRQYKKNIECQLDLELNSGEKLTGTVLKADEDGIEIEKQPEKKSKKVVENIILNFKYSDIKSAKEVITFKK